MSKIMIDPPSGWKYGFPCELKEGKNIEELLREHKYPENDIEFAMQYIRTWTETEEQL